MSKSCLNSTAKEQVRIELKEYIPSESELEATAEIFSVFGDVTRLKIISALLIRELCVCEIAASLHLSDSAISHQLKLLKQARLVKHRRASNKIYYSLDDEHIEHIFAEGLKHVRE